MHAALAVAVAVAVQAFYSPRWQGSDSDLACFWIRLVAKAATGLLR